MSIVLDSVSIPYFRKFNEIPKFSIGKKITVISGYNGVGKSSLMSLMASASGNNIEKKPIDGKKYQPEFSEYFKVDETEPFSDYELFVTFKKSLDFTNTNPTTLNELKNNFPSYYFDYSVGFDNEIINKKSLDFLITNTIELLSTYFCDFTERIGFYDYTKSNRGIRPLPRAKSFNGEDYKAKEKIRKYIGIGNSGRVRIPTIYLSLSRILPAGESNITTSEISPISNAHKYHLHDKFKELYTKIIPNSFNNDSQGLSLTKKTTGKERLFLPFNDDTTAKTQSVGQDNLGSIIGALIDFYYLKEKDKNYTNGILYIDEIEVSFHPTIQRKIIKLLDEEAEKLNLQIIMTSHSPEIIKEIYKNKLKNKNNDYKIIYFKDYKHPYINSNLKTFTDFKADLNGDNSIVKPDIKIYCEDDINKSVFEMLLEAANDLNLFNNNLPKYTLISMGGGENHMISLPNKDDYFKTVLISIDGDMRAKNGTGKKLSKENFLTDYIKDNNKITIDPEQKNIPGNIVFLPGNVFPEAFLFKIIYKYAFNEEDNYDFWRNLPEQLALIDQSKVQEKIESSNITKNSLHHCQDIIDFAKESKIITNYYGIEKNKSELKDWANEIERQLNYLYKRKSASQF